MRQPGPGVPAAITLFGLYPAGHPLVRPQLGRSLVRPLDAVTLDRSRTLGSPTAAGNHATLLHLRRGLFGRILCRTFARLGREEERRVEVAIIHAHQILKAGAARKAISVNEVPIYPTGAIGQGDQQVVVKFYPTSLPKVEPEVTKDDDDGGSGLSTGAIVGIIVGVVGLLIIVVAAAFIILRHLNKVVQTVVESKPGTSTGSRAAKPKPYVSQYRVADNPTSSEMTSRRPSTRRLDSDSSGAIGLGVGVGSPGYASPPLDTPSSNAPNAPAGYQAVPTTSAERHASYDSTFQGGVGYFDMPSEQDRRRSSQQSGIWPWPSGAQPQRQSTDSQSTQQAYAQGHGRQWSDASEQSNPSDMVSPIHQHFGVQELDSANAMVPELHAQSAPSTYPPESPVDPRRSMVSAMSSTVASPRQPAPHSRRRSGEGRTHSDSVTAAQAPLSVVTEDTELIGHYGPPDSVVGKTAAGHEEWVQEMAGSQGWDRPQQQK
ncbi:hypothetical protein VDGE_07702 [Verticillium dahliae]|uniref:Uncharacterized protein n=1 Tax=Verticillium dahliae TaxID=27337 RepID=A0A444S4Q8_VERDA|nr:hypothetical protein VDGE_07702 [Verticillium dahliae]